MSIEALSHQELHQELAIVIPAKNEETYLPKLLASLTRQDYLQCVPTKVFVADAGSTDRTREMALSFRGRLDIHVIAGGMPSVGRNAGARSSRSRYILFLDADVELLDTTLLSRCLSRMRSRALQCATVNIACTSTRFADRFLYNASNIAQKLSTLHRPFGTGMFLLVERNRFEELGGFDEAALFAEDYHFTRRISTLRFAVLHGEVHTSNRRFLKTGHLRMTALFLRTALHSNNKAHYNKDHGYWKHHEETTTPAL